MGKKHVLDSFDASISSQGPDKHIHIPRRLHSFLEKNHLLGKNLRISITLKELN